MNLPQGKYLIRISSVFESSHFLYRYFADGSDEPLHGHSWRVEVFIASSELKNGISVDFVEAKKSLKEICSQLDHSLINDFSPFEKENPTSENIARYIFVLLQKKVQLPNYAFIQEVRVWEGPQNYAAFFPHRENEK